LVALARAARARTAAQLAAREEQIAQLAAVRQPAQTTALASAATAARAALAEAAEAVTTAEDAEEKLRAEYAAGGDPAALRAQLEAYRQRAELARQRDTLAEGVAAAQREYDTAAQALAQAGTVAQRAEQALQAAHEAYARAQADDQAAALRAHLVAGEPCPVCTRPVATVPAVPADSAVAAAAAAGKAARAEAERARRLVNERDATVRDLDRTLTTARARTEAIDHQLAELDARLADAPPPEALRRDLDAVVELERRLADAGAAVRRAREAHRRAKAEHDTAEQRLRRAWREFDATRDALAGYGPPPADRDDLGTAWSGLAEWAAAQADERRAGREEAEAAVAAAEHEARAATDRIVALFAAADVPAPEGDDGFSRAATVAAERARAELEALRARREQADQLVQQRAGYERDAQVARTLAQHLRANNFEAWLLAEALDRLVEGASAILRELSGGQYDLVHEQREFYVVDHHDAGLRRAVRTLSGGETFQASLALALALSEQLAGLSSTSASLESIMLDEGFGTLDAANLESVAATLENLAARGDRMVGVVTHVPVLAERIPVRFEVSRDARSARVERTGL
jgi:exonuclease SbcC